MKIEVKTSRDKDGYFRAWAPALPGCFAYGPSEPEAMDRLNDAIESYLASLDAAEAVHVEPAGAVS